MSTTASPAIPSSLLLTSDQLTVVVASLSSLIFFAVMVALLSIIYRKDPHCCKVRFYQESHGDMETRPQYYNSRQTLVDTTHINDNNTQAGQLFYVGGPSGYGLPSAERPLPRLPSYESVRKKDRQRQIHMMIADRFGLNGPIMMEPPPTYEESMRQSVVDPHDILASHLDISYPQYSFPSSQDAPFRCTTNDDAHSTVLPV